MLTSLFSLFYVTGEFHGFLHRGTAKNDVVNLNRLQFHCGRYTLHSVD